MCRRLIRISGPSARGDSRIGSSANCRCRSTAGLSILRSMAAFTGIHLITRCRMWTASRSSVARARAYGVRTQSTGSSTLSLGQPRTPRAGSSPVGVAPKSPAWRRRAGEDRSAGTCNTACMGNGSSATTASIQTGTRGMTGGREGLASAWTGSPIQRIRSCSRANTSSASRAGGISEHRPAPPPRMSSRIPRMRNPRAVTSNSDGRTRPARTRTGRCRCTTTSSTAEAPAERSPSESTRSTLIFSGNSGSGNTKRLCGARNICSTASLGKEAPDSTTDSPRGPQRNSSSVRSSVSLCRMKSPSCETASP